MTVAVSHDLSIEDVPVNQVRLRFGLFDSERKQGRRDRREHYTLGLLNPVTVDNQGFLICGLHRLLAVKSLGWETIPAIRKDFSLIYSELGEIDENLKRSELNHIEIAEHIVRREELLEQLGLRMKRVQQRQESGNYYRTCQANQLWQSGLSVKSVNLLRLNPMLGMKSKKLSLQTICLIW